MTTFRPCRVAGRLHGLVGAILLCCSVTAQAGSTIYVRHDAIGANDGTSWADAFVSLQEGLAAAGWNLLSLPLQPLNDDVDAFLWDSEGRPAYVGKAWCWNGAEYGAATRIVPGRGYWVYCFHPSVVVVNGYSVGRTTSNLQPGWNLLGPVGPPPYVSIPLPLTSSPPNGADRRIWGLRSGRLEAVTDSLTHGEAYWIFGKAEEGCTIQFGQ